MNLLAENINTEIIQNLPSQHWQLKKINKLEVSQHRALQLKG
jgi:hypothetical protein